MGRKQLKKFIEEATPDYFNVVFITEPGQEVLLSVAMNAKEYLPVWFYDVTQPDSFYQAPTKEDVRSILEWTATRNGPLIVACAAGISRSSATAYLIAYQKTKSVKEALKILDKNKHQPNMLIVKYGSELFKCPELMDAYVRWLDDKLHTDIDTVPLEIIN